MKKWLFPLALPLLLAGCIGDDIVMDYQRFIFPGVQTIHYENNVKNFQIYWDKVCVDTQENP